MTHVPPKDTTSFPQLVTLLLWNEHDSIACCTNFKHAYSEPHWQGRCRKLVVKGILAESNNTGA